MTSSEKEDASRGVSKLEEELSNFFENLMYDWGGSPLLGRIYALCMLTDPGRTILQKDLVTRFNVNASTISRNLKELENWRLIDKHRKPGLREWKYKARETSPLELLLHEFESNAKSLGDRLDELRRIRSHFAQIDVAQEKGRNALKTLDQLTEWIEIVEQHLDAFIQELREKYMEFEKRQRQG